MKSSSIWLDGRNVGRKEGTGVYHYALALHKALERSPYSVSWLLENTHHTPHSSGIYRFIRALLGQCPHPSRNISMPYGTAHVAPDLFRIAHVHYRYKKRLLNLPPANAPDIMHWTYPLPITSPNSINVVTLHDLIPLTHSHLTGIKPHRFRSLIQDIIASGAHFVTVSETVRQEFLTFFTISPERVTTLYQPVGFTQEELSSYKTAPQIAPPNSFIFYGRIENRKNIDALLQAHALSATSTPLILIGPDGDDTPDCSPRHKNSHIIRLPWSNRHSLLRTLSEAKALLFPSLAEGFGLPIIEAMSLGTPVLTSSGGVTEEIAGNAAHLTDPHDISHIAQAIHYMDTLHPNKRAEMIKRGKKRACFFAPEHFETRLVHFYQHLLEKHSSI